MSTGAAPRDLAGYALKALHNISAVLILVSTLVLMGITFSSTSSQNSLYLTTTYLATFYTDTPPLAWAPAGDPYHPQRIADTFYDCLYAAQVGFGAEAGCSGKARGDYAACINGVTASPIYAQKHTALAVRDVLAAFTGDGWDVSVLPSIVTAANLTQVATDLASTSTRAQVVTALTASNSALAREVLRVILDAPSIQYGVSGCLSANSQAPGILHDIAPVYDSLWQCASTIIKTTSDSKEVYDQCIPLTAWPTLDVMQTPYSSTFLGCYNKYFVLVIGGWLLASFAVYTLWVWPGLEEGATDTGKPSHYFARSGRALAAFCFAWNGIGALVMILARSFGDQTAFKGFPMSVQTVLVTWFFALLGTIYFASELWEHFAYGSASGESSVENPRPSQASADLVIGEPNAAMATISSSTTTYGISRVNGGRRYTNLSYFMRPTVVSPVTPVNYTPLLVFTWSDSWVFSDALILIGILGTSPDVVTADVVRVFLTVLYGTAIHTAFVRLLYEGYVNDAPGNEFREKKFSQLQKGEESRQGIRVMSMLADFATLLFMIVTWFLVYGRYGGGNSPLILQYVLICTNIPYVFWLVYHLALDLFALPLSLVTWSQLIFAYNVIARAAFIFVAAIQANKDADANFSGDLSLQNLFALVIL